MTLAQMSSRRSKAVAGLKVDAEPGLWSRGRTRAFLAGIVGGPFLVFLVLVLLNADEDKITRNKRRRAQAMLTAIRTALENDSFPFPAAEEKFDAKLVWNRLKELRDDRNAQRLILSGSAREKKVKLAPPQDYQIVVYRKRNRMHARILPRSGAIEPLCLIQWRANDPASETNGTESKPLPRGGKRAGYYLIVSDGAGQKGIRVLLRDRVVEPRKPVLLAAGRGPLQIDGPKKPGRRRWSKTWSIQQSKGALPPVLAGGFRRDPWGRRLRVELVSDRDPDAGGAERLIVVSTGPDGKRQEHGQGDDLVSYLSIRWEQ